MVTALAQLPADFLSALRSLRAAVGRPELKLQEIPAPARLAPYAVALEAEVLEPSGLGRVAGHPAAPELASSELATGRFILLHDPEPPAVWQGTFRIVTYIRARLEPEMAEDSLLGSVAWTWLVEALEKHGAEYTAAGGTATRVLSESFGTLAGRRESIDIELRASWTPQGPAVRSHLEAWADMICTFAGLPPLPDGVAPLPRRRN
ncbi:DUF3000 domain-containing protein [Sinomonas sp. ASV322]|uniref:DUF3000 domain-containing protein n=1 Tax=Sinomonas sp. ASV322 TaxID=3041920 RepID=UPI0027DE30C6|nr:DUF3000 domain-containing protein [Sinomonas sp. ASV322]MDQ4500894.1 DUF3000 domain-containing protein [Sinomonas sp. ASV322]